MTLRAIGVDVGGTKLAVGGLDERGALTGYSEQPLPTADYDALVRVIANEARACLRAVPPQAAPALGVAVAGWLSPDRERVVTAANLGWRDRYLRRDVAAASGLATVVHNDANAAAWGEYVRHDGPREGALVMLTLGTDVGGGVIVDGRLLTGSSGVAGELGHLRVSDTGPRCVCGQRGCLAVYASGHAMRAMARQAVLSGRRPGSLLAAACANDAQQLTSRHLHDAVLAGDPAALEVLATAATAIATASAQISRVLDHHTLTIGGGASRLGEPLRAAIEAALTTTPPVGEVRPTPQVRLAAAGNEAGVLGAAELALAAAQTPPPTTPSHLAGPTRRPRA